MPLGPCNAPPVSLAEPLMKMEMLPARLKAKRYQSMQVGKWHEGEATARVQAVPLRPLGGLG